MLTVLMALKYYHPDFLTKALDSVNAQTCPDWRLLILVERDDASTFRRLLAERLDDPRVELGPHDGTGRAFPLNVGRRRATSDFVAILHGDDMWAPDAVETLLRNAKEHPEVDFFHSSRRFVDEADRPVSSVYLSRSSFALEEFRWTAPVKHLLCWRRTMGLAIGGIDESVGPHGPDDYDFPWCMAEAGAVFRAVRGCLYIFRDHRETFRLTTHVPLDDHKAGLRRILEKHGVDAPTIERRIAQAQDSYLRQCLYDT